MLAMADERILPFEADLRKHPAGRAAVGQRSAALHRLAADRIGVGADAGDEIEGAAVGRDPGQVNSPPAEARWLLGPVWRRTSAPLTLAVKWPPQLVGRKSQL